MIYLDDRILGHPKIVRAGELLGRNGVSRAFLLFVAGIAYARTYVTDGHIPVTFIERYTDDDDPALVAKTLADKRVGLWHRNADGYRIHDFHDWNETAAAVTRKREVTRVRVARWRAQRRKQSINTRGDS